MSGKLIVFEGTDGSGKATQAKMMAKRLENEGVKFHVIDFPRYGNPFAEPARLYLQGVLGSKPGDVSAYAASVLYAVDRFASYAGKWKDFYENGGVLISDRYTTSNAVHQGGKMDEEQQRDFFRWLYDLEYDKMGLPKPDLVLLLDMPTELSQKLMRHREESTNTKADIHEKDAAYLAACRKTAGRAADFYGWQKISCAKDGDIRTPQEIHEEIFGYVRACLED